MSCIHQAQVDDLEACKHSNVKEGPVNHDDWNGSSSFIVVVIIIFIIIKATPFIAEDLDIRMHVKTNNI